MFSNKWLVSIGLGTFLTMLCYSIGFYFNWFESGINHVEAFGILTSFICTILVNYQSRWNYPFGIISQIAIFYVFFMGGMPALAFFNLYLVFSLAYGFYYWNSDDNPTPVTMVNSTKNWLGYASFALAILALYFGVMYFIEPHNFANISKVDAIIAALSGVAQFLMDRKKLESWFVWMVVNVISIPWLYMQGYYFFAFMYVFFLANAFVGCYAWWRTANDTRTLNTGIAQMG